MAENSNIEWTTHSFNPWRGCSKVSTGCKNCYAETLSGRNQRTLGVWGPMGTRVVAAESQWKVPVRWDKAAKAAGVRHRVFCASLADVFEDWTGPMVDSHGKQLFLAADDAWTVDTERDYPRAVTMQDVRVRLFNLIAQTPNLDWLLLTKRPERLRRHTSELVWNDTVWPEQLPNVWLGTSVEDQETADYRIPHLMAARAKVRFLSVEPLLGPVDLSPWLGVEVYHPTTMATPDGTGIEYIDGVDWVIVGGESGPGARPCEIQWIEAVVSQCRAANVPVFVKQLGAVPTQTYKNVGTSRVLDLRDAKGGDMREWPAALRVRQFPEGAS